MMDRQSIYYYVGLAVFCLIVVVGVVYFLKPRIEVGIPSPVEPPRNARGGQLHTRDPGDIIWDKYPEHPTRLKPMLDPLNPFLWPGELNPSISVTKAPESVPRLGMIIVGRKNRLAFLDQKPVYEGNRHRGFRVEKIAPRAVTLSYSNGKLQLIAPEDHFGPVKVKRVERSRP
ncbi:MAG: hypothetical protein SRB2_02554 [Desulfobacteraceae bacterium Eth-SRB2]|nr:MAG: hypothetical protein SRB2_02554 [Desulfobacteraceae bacterium Eth-SRB2]